MRMKLTGLLLLVTPLVAVSSASASSVTIDFSGGLPPGWMLQGEGGTSPMTGDLLPTYGTQFAWINTLGNTDMEPITGIPYATNGTVLMSAPINVASGGSISMDLNFLTSDGDGFVDFAQVYLLQGGLPIATLYSAQTHEPCTDHVLDLPPTHGCDPGDNMLGNSPGVTLKPYPSGPYGSPCPDNPLTACLDGHLAGPLPDGTTYGPTEFRGTGKGGSSGWVTSSYSPAGGTYQLEFLVSNAYDESVVTALGIDKITYTSTSTTPEPGTLLLFGPGLAGVVSRLRRKAFGGVES